MKSQKGIAPIFIMILVAFVSAGALGFSQREELKKYFETGDIPNQDDFADTIDSAVHFADDRDLIGLKEYDEGEAAASAKVAEESPFYKDTGITGTNPLYEAKTGGTKYANSLLPLGDGKYVTKNPQKGYVYLCNARSNEAAGGAQAQGPWISKNGWDPDGKIAIRGAIKWPDANFSLNSEGSERVFTGNGLPTSHTTGEFPVESSDPAYQYDRNPNSIRTQAVQLRLPKSPVVASSPSCMGGEVGIMLSGVALFNGFDALLRDAAAHEVQDSCGGHPQISGQYHYHSLSECFKDTSSQTVLGFALDGFPITGPNLGNGKYLTTEDLDECHGMTSEIMLDGKKTETYHYVMTMDFPYSVSCFKGKPKQLQVVSGGAGMPTGSGMTQQPSSSGPPNEAIAACNGKNTSNTCSFVSPHGDTISGTCMQTPEAFACVPSSGAPR